MNRPDPAHLGTARWLLAREGVDEEAVTAASRVYDKLHAHLAPLVGDTGVELLLVRSGKLTQGEFAWLAEVSILEGSTKLLERLRSRDPAVSTESAVVLFGTFFKLLTTFIGDRLTNQVLRRAWPSIDEATPRETGK